MTAKNLLINNKRYYDKNKVKVLTRKKQYYLENKDHILKRLKDYRIKSIDKKRASDKKYYNANKESYKARSRIRILKAYGLTTTDYLRLLFEQDYKCAICRAELKTLDRSLSVDHDHKCCPTTRSCCGRCIRGLLCASCNYRLGVYEGVKDDIRTFETYLTDFTKRHSR